MQRGIQGRELCCYLSDFKYQLFPAMPQSTIRSQAPTRRRLEHIEARVSRDQKALIKRAAELSGLTIGEFIASNLQQAALRAIQDAELIRLNAEDSRSFANALRRPRPANAKLSEAARKYLQLISA
jgi:uncharacterized protein (DUF1778 family)